MSTPPSRTPPPYPEASRRRDRLLAVLIVTIAAGLRFKYLDAGVPYAVGIDEPQIMDRAVAMMKSGDFNPHFFDWPSLTIYLNLIVACASFLKGAMGGLWQHLDEVSPADFYVHGRMLTAALGTATVAFVYLIARRWSRAHALLASCLLAVLPYHVRESHFVLADVPTAFFTTLTLWLSVRADERPTLLRFALAGAAAGLATSAKYNGLMAVIVPLCLACCRTGPLRDRTRAAIVVCGAALLAFLIGTPYALLDLPTFLNDYGRLASVFARERPGEPGWLIYAKHLRLAMGWPALLMVAAGVALTAWRAVTGPHRGRSLSLLLFSTCYFVTMSRSYQIYGRYLMPLLPFACVFAAIGAVAFAGLVARYRLPVTAQRLAVAALVLLVLVPPARASFDFMMRFGRDGTVDLAYAWIRGHIPAGARVAVEAQALQLPGRVYSVIHVPSLIARTWDDYAGDRVDFLVASSAAYAGAFTEANVPGDRVAYRTLAARSEQVAVFSPTPDVEGPELRVFRIRR
jgi:hypothetical protein